MSSFNNPILERIFANRDRQEQQANFEAEQNRLRSASAQAFKINSESNKLRREMEVADLARESAEKRVAEAKLKQDNASAQRVFEASVNLGPGDVPNLDNAVRNLREVPIHEQRGGDTIFTADSPGGPVEFSTQEVSRNRLNAQAEAQRAQDFASQGAFYKEDALAQARHPYKIKIAEENRITKEQVETQRFENRKIVSRIEYERKQSGDNTRGTETFMYLAASGQLPTSKLTPALANQLELAGLAFIPEKARKELLEVQETVQIIDMMERLIDEHEEVFGDTPIAAKVLAFWQSINPNSRYNERKAALEARLPQVARIFGEDRLTELDIIRTKGGVIQLFGNSIAQFKENISDLKDMINNKRKGLQGKAKSPQMREYFSQLMSVAEVAAAEEMLNKGKNNEGLGAGNFSLGERYTIDIQTLTSKAEAETTRQGRTVSPEEVLQTVQRNNPTLNISVLGTQ